MQVAYVRKQIFCVIKESLRPTRRVIPIWTVSYRRNAATQVLFSTGQERLATMCENNPTQSL